MGHDLLIPLGTQGVIKYPCRVGTAFTRVWEAGSGSRAVVLIHDAGLRLDWWSKTINALAAEGLRVWCFDLPGHGFADKDPAADHSVAGYAAFVQGVIAARAIHQPILIGAGFGGHVAAAVACENPDAVSGLMLCAPTGVLSVGSRVIAAMRANLTDVSEAGARARALSMVLDDGLVDAALLEDEYCINSSPGAKESLAALGVNIADHLDEALLGLRLAEIAATVPTSLIWGAEDKLVPVALSAAVDQALHGRVQVSIVEGCGHAVYFERPTAFNEAALAFATTVYG